MISIVTSIGVRSTHGGPRLLRAHANVTLRDGMARGEASRDAPVPVVPGEPVFITARSFNAGTSVCRVDVKRNTCTFALKYNVT